MKRSTTAVVISVIWCCAVWQLRAQQPFAEKPKAAVIFRPYSRPKVPPVNLTNSDHLRSLLRAGKLYLTVQDAIALAIENNLDLAVDRYGPLQAQWDLQRAQAGGPLKGVTSGNTFVNQITSGQGVLGAELSAGLARQGVANNGASTNAVISQIGPITPNLDAVFVNTSAWSHKTTPQPDAIISQTNTLIDSTHNFASFVQQGFLSGGYIQVTANETYLKENAPSDVLNPSVAPVAQIYLRHSLLSGFGTAVNGRFIRVARKQLDASNEIFRSQLLNLVASVLNSYWDLETGTEDLKAKVRARDFAQKFYDDTRREIALGAIANFEIYRAAAELSTRKQEIAISQANVQQEETLLKNLISRDGLQDPLLDEADVIPLGRIEVPESDNLPPLRDLVRTALANRPDIALAKINDEAQRISAIGTENGLLPNLQGIVSTTSRSESGTPNPISGLAPEPIYVGGLGNGLGQVFRRDFTDQRGALYLQGTLENRVAQGDYGIDQLQLRQNDLVDRRNMNQLVVDISNEMVALRQARARYSNAVDALALQQELLEKEQQKFSLGSSTVDDVIAAQRALATAQYAQVATLGAYGRARVALDQVLGQTLKVNHVSLADALKN